MDILCLGQQNWDHCWTGKQQLTSRLAERGHRILYVDPRLALPGEHEAIRAASVPGIPGLRHRGPGDLWTYTVLPVRRRRPDRPSLATDERPSSSDGPVETHPHPDPRKASWGIRTAVNRIRRRRGVSSTLRKLGFHAPVVLCLHPGQLPTLEHADPQAIVYYAVDEYTAYGGMSDAARRRVREAEEAILAASDVALAVSPDLCARFARSCPASYVLENGSDVDHYRPEKLARIAPHPGVAGIEGPVIGFIGQVDGRLDQELVAAIADRHPDWTLVLAGRRTVDMRRLEAKPNIRFLGYQPYEALPSFAKQVDVWTVPYVENELTHACNPLKVYEYLATGKPVVSRPLNGLIVCRDVVGLARAPDAFVGAIEAALADPEAGRAARLQRAEDNDWYSRVAVLEDHLEEAIGRAKARGRWTAAVRPLPPASRLAGLKAMARDPGTRSRIMRWRGLVAATRLAGTLLRAPRMARALVRGELPARPERILVAWRGYLGDFILIDPMLAHLRRSFPAATISLGSTPGSIANALFSASPDVDDIVTLDFAPSRSRLPAREWLRRCSALVAKRFDLVVGSTNDHFMEEGLFAGARHYVGLYDGRWQQALTGRALRRDQLRHEAENNLALAEAFTGATARQEARQPRLHFDEAELSDKRTALLQALAIEDGNQVLLVHPGSKRPTRRWPVERLAETVTRLLDRVPDLLVVVTGTEGERALAEDLVGRLPARVTARLRDAVGRTDVAGLAGLLDRADGVLSNDTGIMHLARARGTPLMAVLGPENHRLWGPYPEGAAPAYAIRREVPCAPCRLDDCAAHYCLRSVSVDAVEQAVLTMLERGREPGGGALELDLERRSWSALGRDGFALPLVSVVVEALDADPDADPLPEVLAVIEQQTYPEIEIVHLRPRGAAWAAAWVDDRDAERRRTLPIIAVEADGQAGDRAGDRAWAAAVAAARGELLVRAVPGIDWRPSRLALDVAAATRSEWDGGFFDGHRVASVAEKPDAMIRRDEAVAPAGGRSGTRPAPVEKRQALYEPASAGEARGA